jgi:hypothetical protein
MKMFEKAGEDGWKALIPIYNVYIAFKIVYGDGWKFLFLLIPLANIVFAIKFWFDLAKVFGKGTGFGFGLLLLNNIFMIILAFDHSTYLGSTEKLKAEYEEFKNSKINR